MGFSEGVWCFSFLDGGVGDGSRVDYLSRLIFSS